MIFTRSHSPSESRGALAGSCPADATLKVYSRHAVRLHGDDVVFEETTEPMKDDGSEVIRLMRQSNPDLFRSHRNTYREHELTLTTADQDRVTRAWTYIYGHGCTGKQSPF
jgi:hypothetical protein